MTFKIFPLYYFKNYSHHEQQSTAAKVLAASTSTTPRRASHDALLGFQSRVQKMRPPAKNWLIPTLKLLLLSSMTMILVLPPLSVFAPSSTTLRQQQPLCWTNIDPPPAPPWPPPWPVWWKVPPNVPVVIPMGIALYCPMTSSPQPSPCWPHHPNLFVASSRLANSVVRLHQPPK